MRKEVVREGQRRSRPLNYLTAVTFSADELAALAEYAVAGLLVLRVSKPNRAVTRLKAAMSRVNVPASRGL